MERIWIDDTRPAPSGFRWAKTYEEATTLIDYCTICKGGIDLICFDYDLGEDKTGYDIAKYLVDNHIPVEEYKVHSVHPAGIKNICDLLNHYGYKYQI